MGLLGSMSVRFGADTSGLTAGIQVAKGALSQLAQGNFAGAAVAGLTAIAGAAIGIGVSSVKAAADFQQSMLKVQAYAGLSKQQTTDMSNSILDMASKLGQSPKAMADAIYPIISSGYSASQALQILSLSAKTSAASGAQMSVVADMLTTSLKASGAPASQAGHYMDMFNKIVSLGKGEVPQYAAVIGKLTLAAGSAHVPFDQMGAALATLTTHGFPSVAQASTALGNLFTQIGPKVDLVAQHAKKLGIAFDENKFKTLDLSGQLKYLQDVTGGNQGALLKLLGGSTLALKAFSALSGSSKDLADNMSAMKNSAGATDAAFNTASQGFNASMARMKASADVLQIQIGTALLPVITNITNAVTPLISRFSDWVSSSNVVGNSLSEIGVIFADVQTTIKNLTPYFGDVWDILKQIGAFLLADFTPVWVTLVDVFNNELKPAWFDLMKALQPIMPELKIFGLVIGGVVVGAIMIAIGVVAGLAKGLAGLLTGAAMVFGGIATIVSGFVQVFSGAISFVVDLFSGKWSKLGDDMNIGAQGWIRVIRGVWQVIVGIFTGFMSTLQGFVSGFVSSVGSMLSGISSSISSIHVPGFASGVKNFSGGFAIVGENGPELVKLPQGSDVYPSGTAPTAGGGMAAQSGDQNIYIELDGNTLAHVVGDRQAKNVRLRMGRRAA